MEQIFKILLFAGLIGCALFACLARRLLVSVAIFMSYSVIMSILWVILLSPDLAITEAAVGAGVTTVLFLVALKRIRGIGEDDREHE